MKKTRWIGITLGILLVAAIIAGVYFMNERNTVAAQRDEAQNQLEAAVTEKETLDAQIAHAEQGLIDKDEQIAALNKTIEDDRAALAAAQDELAAVNDSIVSLNADIAGLKDSAEKAEAQYLQALDDIKEKEAAYLAAQAEQAEKLIAAQADNEGLQTEINRIAEELAAAPTRAEVDDKNSTIDNLNAAVTAGNAELAVLQEKLTEAEQNAAELKDKWDALTGELEAAVAKNGDLEKQAANEIAVCAELTEAVEKAQTELKGKHKELDAVYASLSGINAELSLARGKLMKADGEKDALSGQADTLSAELEAAVKKLEDTEAAAAGNRAAQKDLQTGLEKRVAQLAADVKALKAAAVQNEALLTLADNFVVALNAREEDAILYQLFREYAEARGMIE
ncbi:MAG: hypothetical protein FWF47_03995 [Clostridia bacterium]|nr:hypothetical protein [Clostridia bacterium]